MISDVSVLLKSCGDWCFIETFANEVNPVRNLTQRFSTAFGALLRGDAEKIGAGLKRVWMERTFPGGTRHWTEKSRFDKLYLIQDPWSLNKLESERFRFAQVNRVIQNQFGHPSRLLEIGCGEGFQSSFLKSTCDHLYGVDVSQRAVRRARKRCHGATFAVGDIHNLPEVVAPFRFDLVTACEVLYYGEHPAGAANDLRT